MSLMKSIRTLYAPKQPIAEAVKDEIRDGLAGIAPEAHVPTDEEKAASEARRKKMIRVNMDEAVVPVDETKKLDFEQKERNRADRSHRAMDRKKDKDGFGRIGKSLAEEVPIDEAAKGTPHRVHYSYRTGDKSRASGTHTIHAPDAERARSYAAADLKHRPELKIDRVVPLKEETIEPIDEQTDHPATAEMAGKMGSRKLDAYYKNTDGRRIVSHRNGTYHAGAMRSNSLSGLLHLIDRQSRPRPTTQALEEATVLVKQQAKPARNYSVGDIVHPNVGPHKGESHKVIHVHPDGSMNIVPEVSHHAKNKYRLGTARCTDDQIDVETPPKKLAALAKRNTPKQTADEKKAATPEDKTGHVSVKDAKGSWVGRYKSMADAKKLKPGAGHTYHPHKVNEEFEVLSENMEDYLPLRSAEPVNELSTNLLNRYAQGSLNDASKHRPTLNNPRNDIPTRQKAGDKLDSRLKGAGQAFNKIDKKDGLYRPRIKVAATNEQAEPVNELSSNLLGRYIGKAHVALPKHQRASDGYAGILRQSGRDMNKAAKKDTMNQFIHHETKRANRDAGIETAAKKLAREEVNEEQIEEISKNLATSYFDKAASSRGAADKDGDTATVAKRDAGTDNAFSRMNSGDIGTKSRPFNRKFTKENINEGAMADLARTAAEHASKRQMDREEAEDHIQKTLMTVVNQHTGHERTKIHNATGPATREGMEHYNKMTYKEDVTMDSLLKEMSTNLLNRVAAADKRKEAEEEEQIEESNLGIIRSMGKSRTLRKLIPGLGKNEAKERAADNQFDANLKSGSNSKQDPEHEQTVRSGKYSAQAARKFSKIAEQEQLEEGHKVGDLVNFTAKRAFKNEHGKFQGRITHDHGDGKFNINYTYDAASVRRHGGHQYPATVHKDNIEKINEEVVDEGFKVGDMVRATNPKATPQYKVTGKNASHYALQRKDGRPVTLKKDRIHRVNIEGKRLTEDEQLEEDKAYVKPFGDNGWKSSDKSGHVKFWNEHGKSSAHKHAGINEEDESVITEARRGRPPKNAVPGREEDEREHMLMQLRKNVSLNGLKKIKFKDGSSGSFTGEHSNRLLSKYANLGPSHKEAFQAHIDANHANMTGGHKWEPVVTAHVRPTKRAVEGGEGRTIKKPLHRQPLDNQMHARLNMIRSIAAKRNKA